MARPRTPAPDVLPGSIAETQTTTRRRVLSPTEAGVTGPTLADALRHHMASWEKLEPDGYLRQLWAVGYLSEQQIDTVRVVIEKFVNGSWKKRGEWVQGDMIDLESVEPTILDLWKAGRYRFVPVIEGTRYAPMSRPFDVGGEDADGTRGGAGAVDAETELANYARRANQTQMLKNLKALDGPGEDDVKIADIAALIQALNTGRPSGPDPLLLEMIRRQDDSMRQLIERMDRASEKKSSVDPGSLAALVPAVLPVVKTIAETFGKDPGPLVTMFGQWLGVKPPEPERNIVDSVIEGVGALAQQPSVQLMLNALLERMQRTAQTGQMPPALAAASGYGPGMMPPGGPPQFHHAPPLAPPPTTTPNGGAMPMPIALNADQQAAADQIVEWAAQGAPGYDNAYGLLTLFPNSDPLPQAPLGVNLGAMFLMQLAPLKRTIAPAAAVPMLRSLIPRLTKEQAEGLIAHAMKTLIVEEDAAIAEEERERADDARGGA